MEESIFSGILEHLDLTYMLSVNVMAYVIFKMFPKLDDYVEKTVTTIGVGLLLAILMVHLNGLEIKCAVYSFILSLVSWDYILKPIMKRFNIHYDNDNDNK